MKGTGEKRHRLLTQRQAEAQSPCKVQGACGPPEARQLRVGRRRGQLEEARHVFAAQLVVVVAASQLVFVEAVSEGEEELTASKGADANASMRQSP